MVAEGRGADFCRELGSWVAACRRAGLDNHHALEGPMWLGLAVIRASTEGEEPAIDSELEELMEREWQG